MPRTRTPRGTGAPGSAARHRMSREQAVSEVLARIEDAGLSDRRRLEVPAGWAMRNARPGWRRDSVEMRIKALRVVLHPDKNPLLLDRCTEGIKELDVIGARMLHDEGIQTPRPPTPGSSAFNSPPPRAPKTPPDVAKKRKQANQVRWQLLDPEKTDRERIRPPRNTVETGLNWGAEAVKTRYDALGAILRGCIPRGESDLDHWREAYDALEAVYQRLLLAAAGGPRAAASQPVSDPHEVARLLQGEGEMIVYFLSGTHTPTARKGKRIKEESWRNETIGRFLNFMAPILAAAEGMWVATGPRTWSWSRERGENVGHTHGQTLTGVLASSEVSSHRHPPLPSYPLTSHTPFTG